MAKVIDYDVEGVEESGGGTGVKAPPKLYVAKIMKATHRTEKRDGTPANDIELALNVGEQYDWIFTYIPLSEAGDWKLAEFVRAMGLKEKGKLNVDKMVGQLLRVKVNPGTYNGDYSPDAGRLMRAQPGDELDGEAAEAVDEPVPTDDESDADEPTVDADGDKVYSNPAFEPSREGDEGVGSYDDWADEDLEGEVADRDLTIPGGRGNKRAKLIQALRDEDAEVAGGGAEPEEDEPEADEPEAVAEGDDYDEWDLDRLKKEWEDRQMGELPNIRGRNAADRVKVAIIEELRKDDAENPFEA